MNDRRRKLPPRIVLWHISVEAYIAIVVTLILILPGRCG